MLAFDTGTKLVVLKIILTVIISIVGLGLSTLLAVLLKRVLTKKKQKVHTIRLENQGNIASTYRVTVTSSEPALKFAVLTNGIPLPVETERTPVQNNYNPPPAPVPAGFNNQANLQVEAQVASSGQKTDKSQFLAQQGKKAEKVVAKTGGIASLLGMIGGLIPGSVGKSLKEKSASVRDVQTKSKDALEKPKEIQRRTEEVKKSTSQLGVKSAAETKPRDIVYQSTQETGPLQAPSTPLSPTIAPTYNEERFYRTGVVEPGQALNLVVQISSKSRKYTEASYPYTFSSQQEAVADDVTKNIPAVTKKGVVHFQGISKFRYLYPFICGILFEVSALMVILFWVIHFWA